MTKLVCYLSLSVALVAAPAFANPPAHACTNSGGNAAGCADNDPANGEGHTDPNYDAVKHDQTATSEVRVDPYLNAELTGESDGFSSVTMAMTNGEVGDEAFSRTFRIASNADHQVEIWYDAISVNNACVPVFNAEGDGSVAGEADVLGGQLTLKVGGEIIFNASATDSLESATQTSTTGVSIECDDSSETGVDVAKVTVTNAVASTFSREYTLDVTAFGENGSIVFADGSAVNAGDAPAGQYDNDILIAAGTMNNYAYNTQDAYDGAAFADEGTDYYGQ